MSVIDGTSHLMLVESRLEINPLVAGLEVFIELYRLQVHQHLVDVDDKPGA